jgi:hypothetical protein
LETAGGVAVGAEGPPTGRANGGGAFFVGPETIGRSCSSRPPSDAGKSEGSSGRIGGTGGAGRAGGAITGAAGRDTTGGATPTIVFFIAAIAEGGGFAAIVGAAWTPGAAGDGTLIGSGGGGGLGDAETVAGGSLSPRSPPTPTMVDLSGFLGRGASTRGAPGGAIGGAAAPVVGSCGLSETAGAAGGLAAAGAIGGGAAPAGVAGAVGLGKSAPGAVTRNECPHLGHRIFRPAGGTRRSSI